MDAPQDELSGRRKAAILLSLLSPEEAAQVVRHLQEEEVKALMEEVARLGWVGPEVAAQVFREGMAHLEASGPVALGDWTKVKAILAQAFGEGQGAKGADAAEEAPWASLSVPRLVELVRQEHPQTLALLLGSLPTAQAAEVLAQLPAEMRREVALRLLLMDSPSPEAMEALRRTVQESLAPLASPANAFNGLQVLARILNRAPREVAQEVLSSLGERSPDLAEQVQQALFTFEDLLRLDDRSFQRLLREVETRELATALRGASEELQQKVFRNMSQRAAATLREEMEFMGPVRLGEVKAAQRSLVEKALKLEATGEITIPRAGEEVLL